MILSTLIILNCMYANLVTVISFDALKLGQPSLLHGMVIVISLMIGHCYQLLRWIIILRYHMKFHIILPLVERGLYCNHLVCPSVRLSVLHTFVKDVSAATGRNDFIFYTWLWHSDLYRVSPFQAYRTSTSCLPCDLQMNEWGYS